MEREFIIVSYLSKIFFSIYIGINCEWWHGNNVFWLVWKISVLIESIQGFIYDVFLYTSSSISLNALFLKNSRFLWHDCRLPHCGIMMIISNRPSLSWKWRTNIILGQMHTVNPGSEIWRHYRSLKTIYLGQLW